MLYATAHPIRILFVDIHYWSCWSVFKILLCQRANDHSNRQPLIFMVMIIKCSTLRRLKYVSICTSYNHKGLLGIIIWPCNFLQSDWLTRGLSKCVFGPRAVYAPIRTGFPDVDFQKIFKTHKIALKNNFKELPKIS